MVLVKEKSDSLVEEHAAYFMSSNKESVNSYQDILKKTVDLLARNLTAKETPFTGGTPSAIRNLVYGVELESEHGVEIDEVLQEIEHCVIDPSVFVHHPTCMAHLQCPPIFSSIAAEVILSTLNQSMDSWDQSPSATFMEDRMVKWTAQKFGLPNTADGVFTSGGTQSNYMGLLLAREQYCREVLQWDIKKKGLPPEASRFRIFCSEHAHFTIQKSASLLGLGENAVIGVETNVDKEMKPEVLEQKIKEVKNDQLIPLAIVATAGTTDYGSIDPLEDIYECAKREEIWLHVDAAYGGALILSDKQKYKLQGIEHADSLTVDFHKLFYQPVSCGAFLVKEYKTLQVNQQHADYLSPKEDIESGFLHLADKSVQTSRRFDALKLWMTLRHTGVRTLADMIDHTIQTVREMSEELRKHEHFEVIHEPRLNSLVFRYLPSRSLPTEQVNEINRKMKERLFEQGTAVLAKTKVKDKQCLKITLLNPMVTVETVKKVIEEIVNVGMKLEKQVKEDMVL